VLDADGVPLERDRGAFVKLQARRAALNFLARDFSSHATLLLVAGDDSRDAPASAAMTHFARLGGEGTVARLVERFYAHMDSLPEAATIRAMHAAELDEIKRVLRLYLAEWTGGPKAYSTERGHPRLRMRHNRFSIGVAERDAWMACMRRALAEVVEDARLREDLESKLGALADMLRNRPAPLTPPGAP
jgi:hemoglobin